MWLHNFAKLFGYGNILVTEKLLTSHSVFVFTGNFGKYCYDWHYTALESSLDLKHKSCWVTLGSSYFLRLISFVAKIRQYIGLSQKFHEKNFKNSFLAYRKHMLLKIIAKVLGKFW